MRTKRSPGAQRTVTAVGHLSPDYCEVYIAEEQITLGFSRLPNGIRCTSRMRESSASPEKASRAGFEQARLLAVRAMNEKKAREHVRIHRREPIICSSSTAECVLSYADNEYSFYCHPKTPLTWQNLQPAGVFQSKEGAVLLTSEEERMLKQRAFGRIQLRRKHNYAEEGLGAPLPNLQLSFVA